MTYKRRNQGTCSSTTTVEMNQDGIITHIAVDDGCDGNLKGVCALLRGRSAREAIPVLEGIRCEDKPTSCPQQIALCLSEALEKL
ncbi:TIGR03905 family TSCPD domain-containing protein [Ruminococcaceae bacterium OttesenSCG-928-A11]|nr:TIGR03905 family TSCPD domain-containing protein [Ruminococcaceae bacterium OttesenSCG-928-A11]